MYSSRSARKARRRQASARRIQPRLSTSTGLSNLDGPITPDQADLMYKWLVGYGEVAQRALAPHLFPLLVYNVPQIEVGNAYSLPVAMPPPNAPKTGFPLGIYGFTTGNMIGYQGNTPFTFSITAKFQNVANPQSWNLTFTTRQNYLKSQGFFLRSDQTLHDIYNGPPTMCYSYNDMSSQSLISNCRNYPNLIDWTVPPVVHFTWTNADVPPTDIGLRIIVLCAVPTVN